MKFKQKNKKLQIKKSSELIEGSKESKEEKIKNQPN